MVSIHSHRDNLSDLEKYFPSSDNLCNFLALLNFILGEHLNSAAQNATYISNTIQNEIIDVLADQVRQNIIQKVQAAKWYTFFADEVTDVSNREHLSIVLRYVESLVAREDLVGFTECDTGISGLNFAEKIITSLEALGWISQNFMARGMMEPTTWLVQLKVKVQLQ